MQAIGREAPHALGRDYGLWPMAYGLWHRISRHYGFGPGTAFAPEVLNVQLFVFPVRLNQAERHRLVAMQAERKAVWHITNSGF
jgi:hypothetical protein